MPVLKGKRHPFVLSISCCIAVYLVYTKFYFHICTNNLVVLSNQMAFDIHLTCKQPTKSNVYIFVWTWLQYFTNSPQRVFVLRPRPITSRFRPLILLTRDAKVKNVVAYEKGSKTKKAGNWRSMRVHFLWQRQREIYYTCLRTPQRKNYNHRSL